MRFDWAPRANLPAETNIEPPPENILVIKPSSLGDVVHTLPAVALVRRQWPEARLRWLINPEWAPLLAGNPHVDEAVIFPRQELRGGRGLLRLVPWLRGLRAGARPELVLDFQGLLRSAAIARFCCARGGRIVGLSDAREGARFFYHEGANVRGVDHAVDRYLRLVAALGIDIGGPLEWPLPPGDAPADFATAEPFVLLHPFSRGVDKSLAVEDVAALCQALAPLPVVLVGRSEQRVPPLEHVSDLLNRTTLAELIWLIRRAAFVISVDSGPMHIAAALTPRLLALHTWSDPRKVGPYQPEAWVWKDDTLVQMKNFARADARVAASTMGDLAAHVRGVL